MFEIFYKSLNMLYLDFIYTGILSFLVDGSDVEAESLITFTKKLHIFINLKMHFMVNTYKEVCNLKAYKLMHDFFTI